MCCSVYRPSMWVRMESVVVEQPVSVGGVGTSVMDLFQFLGCSL